MIARDRTAIRRADLSMPLRTALHDGVLSSGTEVFDYGCGHGDDIRLDELDYISAIARPCRAG